jgi:hypothetical protein
VKFELEARLHAYAGRPVGVVVRTANELADVLQVNPFPRPLAIAPLLSFLMPHRPTPWRMRLGYRRKRCVLAYARSMFTTALGWVDPN